jgi:hypothetical protein
VTKFSPPMDVTSVVEQFSVLVEQFAKAYTWSDEDKSQADFIDNRNDENEHDNSCRYYR